MKRLLLSTIIALASLLFFACEDPAEDLLNTNLNAIHSGDGDHDDVSGDGDHDDVSGDGDHDDVSGDGDHDDVS